MPDRDHPTTVGKNASDDVLGLAIAAEGQTDPVAVDLAMRRVERVLFDEPSEALQLGRYAVIRRIGSGGHGVIYEAYDPELDRRVALKIQLPDSSPPLSTDRRYEPAAPTEEAKAIARVAHPNVVPVFDVGTFRAAGEDEAFRFIAMELVDGVTLNEWLTQAPRTFAETLGVFIQVADGLTAIHRVGLVHRDVKPQNILVGDDGRTRITDFGLAVTVDPPGELPTLRDDGDGSAPPMGTAGYMAPEQARAERTEPRSDQYAFCVCLRESVSAPRRPRRLERLLGRGLAQAPEDRWPSMLAVATELRACLRPRRRALIVAGAAMLAATVALGSVLVWSTAPDGACAQTETRAARVWNASRQAALRHRWTERRHRIDNLVDALDHYAQTWHTHLVFSCTRDPPPPGELACINDRLEDLDRFATVLESTENIDLERATWAAANLQSNLECGLDRATMPGRVEHSRAQTVRLTLKTAWAHQHAGDLSDAAGFAERAVATARELDHPSLVAEALFRAGSIERERGHPEAASARLEEAALTAIEHEDDAIAVQASAALVHALIEMGDPRAALRQARQGWAFARRRGDDRLVHAAMLGALSAAMEEAGQYADAVIHQQSALAVRKRHLGPTELAVGDAHHDLGNAYFAANRHEDALKELAQAESIYRNRLGSEHQRIAQLLHNRGSVLGMLGRRQEAAEHFADAIAILRAIDPAHPILVTMLDGAGIIAYERGETAEAVRFHEEALRIAHESLHPHHPQMANTLVNLANARATLDGDETRALQSYERALAIYIRVHGEDHPRVADTMTNLANSHRIEGRLDHAIGLYARALEIYEAHYDHSDPRLGPVLRGLGTCHAAKGDARGEAILARARAVDPP